MRSPLRNSSRIIAGAAAAGLLLAGCGTGGGRPLDVAGAERQMANDLSLRTGMPAPVVRCPAHVTVKQGGTFTCSTVLDGQALSLKVTLTNGKGAFTSQPLEAVLLVAKAVKAMEDGIDRQTGEKATVDCGSHTVLVAPVGDTFSCTATAKGQCQAITVTVRDLAGTLDYRTTTPGSVTPSTAPGTSRPGPTASIPGD
jgi:Domain of unknown function (DUF4333)